MLTPRTPSTPPQRPVRQQVWDLAGHLLAPNLRVMSRAEKIRPAAPPAAASGSRGTLRASNRVVGGSQQLCDRPRHWNERGGVGPACGGQPRPPSAYPAGGGGG